MRNVISIINYIYVYKLFKLYFPQEIGIGDGESHTDRGNVYCHFFLCLWVTLLELLLSVFRGLYGMPKIELRLTICKTSICIIVAALFTVIIFCVSELWDHT